MDDYDEESREYYQEYRANYGDPQIKQRFRRITDGGNIGLNTLIEEWKLKIPHHDTLSKSQPKDL